MREKETEKEQEEEQKQGRKKKEKKWKKGKEHWCFLKVKMDKSLFYVTHCDSVNVTYATVWTDR